MAPGARNGERSSHHSLVHAGSWHSVWGSLSIPRVLNTEKYLQRDSFSFDAILRNMSGLEWHYYGIIAALVGHWSSAIIYGMQASLALQALTCRGSYPSSSDFPQ